MSSSNPLAPIYKAYEVSSDCFKVAKRTIRDQQATLVHRTQFYGLAEADANSAISDAASQASDLAILALFATFERFVIEHLQTANQRLSNGFPAGYSSKLAKKFKDEVEYWRLDQILDLFKGEIDGVLLGQAKQIKDYRDWIAHRNPRRAPPAQAEPRATFEVLTQIIEQIRSKHTPPADAPQMQGQ